jgi:two-component system response regulator DegU
MIKVLLVDDTAIVRKAIKDVLNKQPDIQVIGECTDGDQVMPFLQNNKPDIILMDYKMPTLDGVQATKMVKDIYPEIKVIGFSCNDDQATKNDFYESGAVGFLSKYNVDNMIVVNEIKIVSQ